jgi:putative transposase
MVEAVARRPRYLTPDGVVHVTSRGNRRQDVYIDVRDRRSFDGILDDVVQRFEIRVLAYCQMRNHYHLLAFAERAALSDALHRLNGVYAQRFNRRHGVDGHLFQDRFHGQPVTTDWHLFALFRYVVLNPVRAGICDTPAEWHWSSYRATAGIDPVPRFLAADWVLGLFHADPLQARALFARFVHEGIASARDVAA